MSSEDWATKTTTKATTKADTMAGMFPVKKIDVQVASEVKIGVATEVVRPKESGLGTTSAGVVPEARRNTTTGATTAAQVLQICKLCLVAAMRNISEMIMIGRAQAVLVAVIVQAAAAGSSR